jgi:DNA-binding IclR family transcriptional regulator
MLGVEERVVDVLESADKRALSLSEIADALDEPEPRVSRILERGVDAGRLDSARISGVRVWWVVR